MNRRAWGQLPAEVRHNIEQRTGPVLSVDIPSAGRNSDFSAVLQTEAGLMFCKGIASDGGRRVVMHRHEADVAPWLPPDVAPRLRWTVESDGWLMLLLEHVPGRHVDFTPGSPDLQKVAETVNAMSKQLAYTGAPAPVLADQWARMAAWRRIKLEHTDRIDERTRSQLHTLIEWENRSVDLAAGGNLVHTDLHPLNILVTPESAKVVDWAWSRIAAPAVDAAFLVARLIAAGHSPAAAEEWASNELDAWRFAGESTRTAFAVAIFGIWTYQSIREPRPLWGDLVSAAKRWVDHLM